MVYTLVFSLKNAVYFIILTYFVPVLFTFYIQGVLKLKNNSGAKRLTNAMAVTSEHVTEPACFVRQYVILNYLERLPFRRLMSTIVDVPHR